MYKEYKNIFDVVDMFRDETKVKDFFKFVCQAIIKEAKRVDLNDETKYYPVVYSKEHKTLSISFNFFVSCIAKCFDAGNKSTEDAINYDLKIIRSTLEQNEALRFHKNRTLIIINILQDFYGILHPNNRKINVTKLTGVISSKDSYFIPIVYEDNYKNAIQYEMIPLKIERLQELYIEHNLLDSIVEIGLKASLNDVAFNQKNVQLYWNKNPNKKVLRYQD